VENPVFFTPEENGERQMRHHGHAGDTFGCEGTNNQKFVISGHTALPRLREQVRRKRPE
jgi:hypothetical protein